jgi:hypothetical protein
MILRGHSRDRKSLRSSLNFCRSCTKVHSPSIDRPLRQKELIEYQRIVDLVHLRTLAMANVRWIWSKPETGKKKRYLQLHKQGRSHTIAISLNKKPIAKHANSCTLQSRKLAPSRVGLQKNFQKSFPQTNRRADIILPSQSSQTRPKQQGDRHVVYESKEKKPPQNTALLYQCQLFQAHRNPPTPPNVRRKKKKTNH